VLTVGELGLDLLEATAGEERRGAADEWDQANTGQPGARPDEILLRDSDIDQSIGELRAESREAAGPDGVVAHDNDAAVMPGELDERVGERQAVVVELGRRQERAAAHASSWRASSTCSADGTL
jgi:hypothetical protein